MKVLVDTSVWSLAFRKAGHADRKQSMSHLSVHDFSPISATSREGGDKRTA